LRLSEREQAILTAYSYKLQRLLWIERVTGGGEMF